MHVCTVIRRSRRRRRRLARLGSAACVRLRMLAGLFVSAALFLGFDFVQLGQFGGDVEQGGVVQQGGRAPRRGLAPEAIDALPRVNWSAARACTISHAHLRCPSVIGSNEPPSTATFLSPGRPRGLSRARILPVLDLTALRDVLGGVEFRSQPRPDGEVSTGAFGTSRSAAPRDDPKKPMPTTRVVLLVFHHPFFNF